MLRRLALSLAFLPLLIAGALGPAGTAAGAAQAPAPQVPVPAASAAESEETVHGQMQALQYHARSSMILYSGSIGGQPRGGEMPVVAIAVATATR